MRAEDPAKAQEMIGGKGFSVKKVDGKGWMIARGGEKTEGDNPADHYNTVLKMAKKRALVDAVLTATAASDIFTQDLEDITANLALATPPPALEAPTVHRDRQLSEDVVSEPQAAPTTPQVVASRQPMQVTEVDEPEPDLSPAPVDRSLDFRETRIHFGKNRGLMLSELSPQQVHWYENEWMPKKEVNGPTSVEDLALMNALKAYNAWRSGGRPADKAQSASKPATSRARRQAVVENEAF